MIESCNLEIALSIFRYPFDTGQNAADMFLVDPAISAKYHKAAMSHSGFIGSNLENVWGIFISQSVEPSLKESAAEQLAVLLQGLLVIL